MKRILDGGEVAWEDGQRIPVQLVPIECVPGNDPEPQDDSADEIRGEVLESVRALLIYLSESRRPEVLLDALAVITGLILSSPNEATALLARKHGISYEEFQAIMAEVSRKLNLSGQSIISQPGRAELAGCSNVPPCPPRAATINPMTC